MDQYLDGQGIDRILALLERRLQRNGAPPVRLVVCGGASLIATGLVSRTTKDVDVVAFLDDQLHLVAPVPWPDYLDRAAREVAETLNLPGTWLNNSPSRDTGGLFQMGLPEGFQARLQQRRYGSHLDVHFVSRLDQIHFKLYAAVDQGGRHTVDLQALGATESEIRAAARWAVSHDVSPGFRMMLLQLTKALGYGTVADSL